MGHPVWIKLTTVSAVLETNLFAIHYCIMRHQIRLDICILKYATRTTYEEFNSFATISNSMENELKYLYNKNIQSAAKLRS